MRVACCGNINYEKFKGAAPEDSTVRSRMEPLVLVMIWMLIARFPVDCDETIKKDGRIVNLKALQMTTC